MAEQAGHRKAMAFHFFLDFVIAGISLMFMVEISASHFGHFESILLTSTFKNFCITLSSPASFSESSEMQWSDGETPGYDFIL